MCAAPRVGRPLTHTHTPRESPDFRPRRGVRRAEAAVHELAHARAGSRHGCGLRCWTHRPARGVRRLGYGEKRPRDSLKVQVCCAMAIARSTSCSPGYRTRRSPSRTAPNWWRWSRTNRSDTPRRSAASAAVSSRDEGASRARSSGAADVDPKGRRDDVWLLLSFARCQLQWFVD